MDNYVFTQTDPRTDGYKGDVVEGVTYGRMLISLIHYLFAAAEEYI